MLKPTARHGDKEKVAADLCRGMQMKCIDPRLRARECAPGKQFRGASFRMPRTRNRVIWLHLHSRGRLCHASYFDIGSF
jgi:hypothetical protein